MSDYYGKRDYIVRAMVNDSNYRFYKDGSIHTCIGVNGKPTGSWRKIEVKPVRGYIKLKYKGDQILAHRVIYQKFLGELKQGLTINHKDGNGLNNSIENLELVTSGENGRHKYRVLKCKPPTGNAKINYNIANEIRAKYRTKEFTYLQLAELYGLSKSGISYIIKNKSWVNPN